MAKADDLRARVKEFAAAVICIVRTLPRDPAAAVLANQLAKAGTSVSANYHSAGRSRSGAEFVSRLAIVLDEADEAVHWLELVRETQVATGSDLDHLITEARELRAIFFTALRTARRNRATPTS